jgi:YD repeat-containing protein
MRDSTGRTTFTYHALSRRTRLIRPSGYRITYTFDAASQPRNMTPQGIGGRMTYVYDAAGRISLVRDPANERTTYAYDAAGRRTTKRLANGTRATFT